MNSDQLKIIQSVSHLVHLEFNKGAGWYCEIYLRHYHESFAAQGDDPSALIDSLYSEIVEFLNNVSG